MFNFSKIIFAITIFATAVCFSQKIDAPKNENLKFQIIEFSSTKKLDSAIVAENKLLDVAKSSKQLDETINSNLKLSNYYLNKNNALTAIDFAKAALSLGQEDRFAKVQLRANLNLARAFQILGEKQKAFNFYETASKIAEKFKIENRDAIDALAGKGMLINHNGSEKDSTATSRTDYFAKAISLAQKIKDEKAEIDVSTYQDNLWLNGKSPDFDAIAKRFQRAMDFYKEKNDVAQMSRMHHLFAKLYAAKGNEKAAISYYSANLKLNDFEGNDINLARANNDFANYLTKNKKFGPASALYAGALKIKQNANSDLTVLSEQAKLVSQGFERAKNYKSAYENLLLYNQYRTKIIAEQQDLKESLSKKSTVREPQDEKIKLLPIPQTLTEKDNNTQKDLFFVAVVFALGAVVLLYIAYRRKSQPEEDHERMRILKARLLHNIAQEFGTPLSLMKQPLEHLRTSLSDDGHTKHITKLSDTSEHILKLVDQLSKISKIERGTMELNTENGKIFDFISKTIEPFAADARNDGHTLISNVEDSSALTNFDSAVLENIISILLANAFHYSNDKDSIYFSAIRDNKVLKIGFSHNAGKLTSREVERLFEQLSSQIEINKGSGIGLELAKNLITIYDGIIETKLNENGLHYTVLLPWDLNNIPQKKKNSISQTKKKLVLVAADDKRNRNEILLLLEDHYEGIETDNGANALTLAKQRRPDVVISYQKLQGMDGNTLSKLIKSDPETVGIPVILIASSEDNNFNQASVSSADATLRSPINGSELNSYLAEFVPENN